MPLCRCGCAIKEASMITFFKYQIHLNLKAESAKTRRKNLDFYGFAFLQLCIKSSLFVIESQKQHFSENLITI